MFTTTDGLGITLGPLTTTGTDSAGVKWSTANIEGWAGPGPALAVSQKPRGNGGWAGDSYLRPRHVVLSGLVAAPSQAALSDAIDRLNVACALEETLLTVDEQGRSRWCMVRREDEVLAKMVAPTLASWSVQVVALDPRKMGDVLTASTGLPASSGGLTVPFTVPFTIASTVISGQASLTNPGNTAGPVLLRIDGPCTGPVITHVGTGLRLVFASSLVLAAGEWLTVNMEARTAMANDQANRANWITSRGWSSFEVGANTWAFTALTYSAGAMLTVTATPSWQ